jgi:SAM-dependent methyltransferase
MNDQMQTHEYGTKFWFDHMFSCESEGNDRWGHQWRGSQQYRYSLTLGLIKELDLQSGNRTILDIGCGLGDFSNMIYQLNRSNRVFGMDISEYAVRGALKKYPHIKFKTGALPEIIYDRKFSMILSLDCICYLCEQKRRQSFQTIWDHLENGGSFVFSSPLDDGSRFFRTEDAIEQIAQVGFRIQKIRFNYSQLYT